MDSFRSRNGRHRIPTVFCSITVFISLIQTACYFYSIVCGYYVNGSNQMFVMMTSSILTILVSLTCFFVYEGCSKKKQANHLLAFQLFELIAIAQITCFIVGEIYEWRQMEFTKENVYTIVVLYWVTSLCLAINIIFGILGMVFVLILRKFPLSCGEVMVSRGSLNFWDKTDSTRLMYSLKRSSTPISTDSAMDFGQAIVTPQTGDHSKLDPSRVTNPNRSF